MSNNSQSVTFSIQHKYKRLISVNEKLSSIAESFIAKNPQINTPKDGIASFMLAKAYKTHGVILKLVKLGYSEDADILARSLFDSAVIISACISDITDKTAWKYLNFDYSTRAEMFKHLIDKGKFREYFEERTKNPKLGDESIEEICNKAEKFKKEYGGDFKQKWHSGKTTGEMAELVNLKDYFETAYKLHTQLTHSLPRCVNRYLIDDGEKIILDVTPKNDREIGLSLASSFDMFFRIVEKFNKHYKMIDWLELKPLVEEYGQSVKKEAMFKK